MNTHATSVNSVELVLAVRRELVLLAKREEEAAAAEAARTPYWGHTPISVFAHRAAALALREDAARMGREAHAWPPAS